MVSTPRTDHEQLLEISTRSKEWQIPTEREVQGLAGPTECSKLVTLHGDSVMAGQRCVDILWGSNWPQLPQHGTGCILVMSTLGTALSCKCSQSMSGCHGVCRGHKLQQPSQAYITDGARGWGQHKGPEDGASGLGWWTGTVPAMISPRLKPRNNEVPAEPDHLVFADD